MAARAESEETSSEDEEETSSEEEPDPNNPFTIVYRPVPERVEQERRADEKQKKLENQLLAAATEHTLKRIEFKKNEAPYQEKLDALQGIWKERPQVVPQEGKKPSHWIVDGTSVKRLGNFDGRPFGLAYPLTEGNDGELVWGDYKFVLNSDFKSGSTSAEWLTRNARTPAFIWDWVATVAEGWHPRRKNRKNRAWEAGFDYSWFDPSQVSFQFDAYDYLCAEGAEIPFCGFRADAPEFVPGMELPNDPELDSAENNTPKRPTLCSNDRADAEALSGMDPLSGAKSIPPRSELTCSEGKGLSAETREQRERAQVLAARLRERPARGKLSVRDVTVQAAWSLREAAAIQSEPGGAAKLLEDTMEGTRHIAVYVDEMLACVGTAVLPRHSSKNLQVDHAAALDSQLVHLVTFPELRGCGLGSFLLKHLCKQASHLGKRRLWCNAYAEKESFFERCGWRRDGPCFGSSRKYVRLACDLVKTLQPTRKPPRALSLRRSDVTLAKHVVMQAVWASLRAAHDHELGKASEEVTELSTSPEQVGTKKAKEKENLEEDLAMFNDKIRCTEVAPPVRVTTAAFRQLGNTAFQVTFR